MRAVYGRNKLPCAWRIQQVQSESFWTGSERCRLAFVLRHMMKKTVLLVVGLGAATVARADLLPFNFTDFASMDGFDDPDNLVATLHVAGPILITGIGWDVTLNTVQQSWLSDMRIKVSDSSGAPYFKVAPALGDDFTGTKAYNSGGIIDLSTLGISYLPSADGSVSLQMFEATDQFPGAADGFWNGTVTVQYNTVPEPASLAILSLGALALVRRKMQRV